MRLRPQLIDVQYPPAIPQRTTRYTGRELFSDDTIGAVEGPRSFGLVEGPPKKAFQQQVDGNRIITERKGSRTGSRWVEIDEFDEDGECALSEIVRVVKPRSSAQFVRQRELAIAAGLAVEPSDEVLGQPYTEVCRDRVPTFIGHPSNYRHIVEAQANVSARSLEQVPASSIAFATRLFAPILCDGNELSKLDPEENLRGFLAELRQAHPGHYVVVQGFLELVVRRAGSADAAKSDAFLEDAIAERKWTRAEKVERAEVAQGRQTVWSEDPGNRVDQDEQFYLVPHAHVLVAVMNPNGSWLKASNIQGALDRIQTERYGLLVKGLGGRWRGGRGSKVNHIRACVTYAIKREARFSDFELQRWLGKSAHGTKWSFRLRSA